VTFLKGLNAGAIFLGFFALFDSIFKLLFLVLTARELSVETFANLQLTYTIYTLITTVSTTGLIIGLPYFYGSSPTIFHKVSTLKRFFGYHIALALLVSIFFLILSNLLAYVFSNSFFSIYKYHLTALIFFTILSSYFKGFYVLIDRVKVFSLIGISILLGYSFVLIALLPVVGNSIEYIYYILIVFNVTIIFFFGRNFFFHYRLKDATLKMLRKVEFRYILIVGFSSLIGVMFERTDQIMVSLLLGSYDFAQIRVGGLQLPVIPIVLGAVVSMLLPKFSKFNHEKDYQGLILLWRKSAIYVSLLLLPVLVFSVVFSEQLILLVFGDRYIESVGVFELYTIRYFLAIITTGAVMGSLGMEKRWLINDSISLVINILLNLYLIPIFGIIGAAIATYISWNFSFALNVHYINKRLKCRFTDYFPIFEYAKVLFVSLIFASIFYYFFIQGGFVLIGILPFSIVFYFVVVLVLDLVIFNGKYLRLIYLNLKDIVSMWRPTKL